MRKISSLLVAVFATLSAFAATPNLRSSSPTTLIIGKQATVVTTKEYDGTTDAVVTDAGSLIGLKKDAKVTLNAVAEYADASAGAYKKIKVTYSLTGEDAGSYVIAERSASFTIRDGKIEKKVLEVSGTEVADKEYDGTTKATVKEAGSLAGVISGDEVQLNAEAAFVDNFHVGQDKRVLVRYSLSGANSANYTVAGTANLTADILPCQISAEGIVVSILRMEGEGNDASILVQPVISGIAGNDDVTITAVAKFDNNEPGENKTITVYYTITGADAENYIVPESFVYSTEGKILEETVINPGGENEDEFFSVNGDGYCPGDTAGLTFELGKGSPVAYKVICSEKEKKQGFKNIEWDNIPEDGVLPFSIPENCEPGKYSFGIVMKNELGVETEVMNVVITVNLSELWIDDMFVDMITLVDPEGKYANMTYQWYKNNEPILNATLPYYYEEGGLNGYYYLMINPGTDDEIRTVEVTYSAGPKSVVKSTKVVYDGEGIVIIDENGNRISTSGVAIF